MNTEIAYLSSELELFEHAVNWKKYFSSYIRPFISGDVAEIGAGIGTTTPYLLTDAVKSYTLIEPDFAQADKIQSKINEAALPPLCKVEKGILAAGTFNKYDAITYIDVIEHIEDDKAELIKAGNALKAGGYLCILVPANPKDYSPFDKEIGHFRRYNKKMILEVLPAGMQLVSCRYFDVCGSVSSKMNKYILKQSYPTKKQILFWDRIMIPLSRVMDMITGYHWGKSLLLIAKK